MRYKYRNSGRRAGLYNGGIQVQITAM